MGQLFADFNALYGRYGNRRATRDGEVGQKTRRERRVILEAALRELHRAELELRRLKNFRAKHVRSVLQSWRQRGLKPATLSVYISHLRVFCGWLDKPQLIAMIDDYLAANPKITRRRLVTDRDRSERGAGVAFEDIFTQAVALDERYACTLLLVKVFGLRILEALLLRPHLVEGEHGEVRIFWGTKGGRPRVLPSVINDLQRLALAWAQTFAQHRADSMVPPTYTLQRWRRRCYYLNEKMGFTRTGLGATPHALRHGVSCDLYEELAGEPAPVRGGTLAQKDPDADRTVRDVIAEHLGHSRPQIVSAYVGGTVPSSKRSKVKSKRSKVRKKIIDSSPPPGDSGPSTLGPDSTPLSDGDTPQ